MTATTTVDTNSNESSSSTTTTSGSSQSTTTTSGTDSADPDDPLVSVEQSAFIGSPIFWVIIIVLLVCGIAAVKKDNAPETASAELANSYSDPNVGSMG